MRHARAFGLFVFVLCAVVSSQAATKDDRPRQGHVEKIRVTDSGAFQVWNGIDGDAADPDARVLAVIGPKKSLRVNYSASTPAPQVTMGAGWVEVTAGEGTAMTFSSPKSDCYYNLILWCTDRPITGIPAGSIVCMCIAADDSICCSSDTGIWPKRMVPIQEEL